MKDWTDRVQCEICGKWYGRITPAHLKLHGTTLAEYIKEYPNSLIVSPAMEKQRRRTTRVRFDLDAIDRIAEHLSVGITLPIACALEKQSFSAIQGRMSRLSRELTPIEHRVVSRVREGLAKAQSTAIGTLWSAIVGGDTRAAMWFLERTDPKRWMLNRMDGPLVSLVLPQNSRSVLYLSQEETAQRVTALLESVNERPECKTDSPFVVPGAIDGVYQPVEVASGTEVSTQEER